MSYKHNIIKERFDLVVDAADKVIKKEWELDSNAEHLLGIAITSDQEELLYYRGSQKMQINDQELFPEDFESKLLITGINVAPNERMVKVGRIETGNGLVEIWFKDTPHPGAAFTPYRVTVYFFSKARA